MVPPPFDSVVLCVDMTELHVVRASSDAVWNPTTPAQLRRHVRRELGLDRRATPGPPGCPSYRLRSQ